MERFKMNVPSSPVQDWIPESKTKCSSITEGHRTSPGKNGVLCPSNKGNRPFHCILSRILSDC